MITPLYVIVTIHLVELYLEEVTQNGMAIELS